MSLNVDENGILQPLGFKWLKDNRFEIVPSSRRYTEAIPGRDGEIVFGRDLQPKRLKATVGMAVSNDASDSDYRTAVFDRIAAQLNPHLGEQSLTFADEPGKVYMVELFDVVDVLRERGYAELELSFEVPGVYKSGPVQKSLTGSGTAVNSGNSPAPIILIIEGPVTNPSVAVGGREMAYDGEIAGGSVLIVDTGKLTAVLDGANALPNYNGAFPKLQPGNNIVTAAAGGTTMLTWFDRWL